MIAVVGIITLIVGIALGFGIGFLYGKKMIGKDEAKDTKTKGNGSSLVKESDIQLSSRLASSSEMSPQSPPSPVENTTNVIERQATNQALEGLNARPQAQETLKTPGNTADANDSVVKQEYDDLDNLVNTLADPNLLDEDDDIEDIYNTDHVNQTNPGDTPGA